jgi:putative tricarboxylic transport membrane protein
MSEQTEAPTGPSWRDSFVHLYAYLAFVWPGLLAIFALWAGWRTTGNIALTLIAAAVALILVAGFIAWRGLHIPNPQDYYGGLALIALSLFAFWAANDLPGMRGFSFGPGTAPRLFAGVLLTFGVIITAMGVFTEGKPLERYAVRGPFWITVSILIFALTVRQAGLIIATFLSFVVSGAGSAETRWVENIIAGVVMTAFAVGLFVYLLNLPFQLWPRF